MGRQKIILKDTFKVINNANDLCIETLRVICNDDIFPKRSRWLIAGKIADLVNDFHTCMHLANEIRVSNRKEADDRHRYQILALSHLEALEEKIELAKVVLNINVNKVEEWSGKWNEEEKLLKNWISKDTKRYADL